MERRVLAVVVGYFTAVILVMVSMSVFMQVWPELFPDPVTGHALGMKALMIMLILNLLFAAVGGCITSTIAQDDDRKLAVALGFVMIGIDVLTLIMEGDVKPLWWHRTMIIFLIPCTVLGASLYQMNGRKKRSIFSQ
jgi:hypothetical protein